VSQPVTTPLCVEFRHPRVTLRFRVLLPAGVLQPVEVCRAVNQGLQTVVPGARLLDYQPMTDTVVLRVREQQTLLVDALNLYQWLEKHPALEPGAGGGWSIDVPTTVWEEEPKVRWTPREDPPRQLRVKNTPTVGHKFEELRSEREQIYHVGLVLPPAWAEERISMERHPFNLFNSGDPLNQDFAAHLAVRLGDILSCPPLVRELGPRFPVVVNGNTVRAGVGGWSCPIAITLRLDPFWRSYFLPESLPVSNPDWGVPLSVVESYRPHPSFQSDILLTTTAYPRRGQSVYPTPFTLCCPLFGDNFLKPTWTLPMIALVEPRGPRFELVHQPTLKLENIEGLGAWSYYSLLDANGVRIPCGPPSRLWVELVNMF
jgi:hypothetical protein